MALLQATYPIAPRGLATNFEETALPPDYALRFRNRYINAAGGAEKRRGIVPFGGGVLPGAPNLTGLHELVNARTGITTLFASGDGRIYRYSTDTSAWTTAHDCGFRGVMYQSVQMVDRLIFVNGTSRNIYTKDGVNFTELEAIVYEGRMGGGTSTSAGGFLDGTVSGATGFTELGVAENDIVHNLTRNRIGSITTLVSSASGNQTIVHTSIAGQQAGDRYRIIDTVELNIIPTEGDPDNVATINGFDHQTITVSGFDDWPGSEIRLGDYVVNSTRNAVAQVRAIVSGAIGLLDPPITGQVAGDSISLHKSAMPIAERVHIHYGRAYYIDSRNRHEIRISGPDDPSDMTTSTGTIDAATFSFGSQQPTGDVLRTMVSYQRFLVMAGNRFTLLFEGTDPIADTSADNADFNPVGLFPQGARSPNAMATIGNDVAVISDDGVQSFALRSDASTLGQENLSEALKNTLRDLISATPESEIYAFHYPRRSWVCFKIGAQIYVYNYTPYFGQTPTAPALAFTPQPTGRGSWSLFDGKFARQKAFLVRQDGTLICAGDGGRVYTFDAEDVYADDGEIYSTEYQSGWLTLDEPRRSLQIKQGNYIQPTFHVGGMISYTIRAEAPFNVESSDQITINATGRSLIGSAVIGSWKIGGSGIFDNKFPLRWRGKEMRLTISTNDSSGPDVISRFTLYINRFGVR